MAIAITPDSRTAYVTLNHLGMVIPVRTATNTALPPMRAGQGPWGIAITPDGRTAYVANYYPPGRGPGTVTPIRIATNTVLKPVKTGGGPYAIAITPR